MKTFLCPKCKSELGTIPIMHGDRKIGTNIFCLNMDCSYETDTR